MNKLRLFSAFLALAMLLSLLSGCGCNHKWKEANCGAPKTCTRCGVTEGEKVGDHTWMDATTDAPKTCSVCGETTGKKIETDYRFQTSKCKHLFGTWEGYTTQDATQYGAPDYKITLKLTMIYAHDGFMKMTAELQDPTALASQMALNVVNQLYQVYAMFGMTPEDIEKQYQTNYGMSAQEYFTQQNLEKTKEINSSTVMVYYVEDGKIYVAENWNRPMEFDGYEMKDGKLLLDDKDLGQIVEFTRVSE